MKNRIFFLLIAFFLFLDFSPGPAEAGEKVVYRLKWLFNCSTVGDLYAHDMGYFKANGLDVEIKAGGPERDAIKELELGYATFGVASADQVIRARSKGSSVAVVAQLFQINPLQWIYRPDLTKIDSLGDIAGKTIGITYGGNDETIMRTLLAKAGLVEEDVKLFSVRYDYTPFYRKKVDLWPVYRNTQAVFIGKKLADANEQVAFFSPAKFGVRFVANSVVTSEKTIKKRPELVSDFLSALLKGWEEALKPENREKAIAVLRKRDRDTKGDIMLEQLKQTRLLVKPLERIRIGNIDASGWKMTERIMLDQKIISKPVHVEKVLYNMPD